MNTKISPTEVATYLAENYQKFGGTLHRNAPPSIFIPVAGLPHNDILDDDFFAALGNTKLIHLLEGQNAEGEWGEWYIA